MDDDDGPRTARIVPLVASSDAEPSESAPPVEALPASPRSLGLGRALAIGGVLAMVAGALAFQADRDPPTPDVSLVETDTDATMWIPEEDAGAPPADASLASESDAGELDAGPPAEPDAGLDAGESRARPMGALRVTSDGSLTVRLDGRAIGHAPIASLPVTPGEHRLVFECDFLGRSAEESIRFVAGSAVRVRVTCATTPPRVVVAAP